MRAVPRFDTKPEMRVRQVLHRLGYRFRTHRSDLPGKPDVVLPKHKTVVFVHGCFWHRHAGCKRCGNPKTRIDYWQAKFARNVTRDAKNVAALLAEGWKVVVIWECETKDLEALGLRLAKLS